MKPHVLPLNFERQDASPEVDVGEEVIALAVTELRYTQPLVEIELHASFQFPSPVAQRYFKVNDAVVLVGTDVDHQDCFAVRMVNEFVRSTKQPPKGTNLEEPPALPLAPRGDPDAMGFEGGYVNGALSFESPRPVHSPSIYLYMILENYVSNVVGLDLLEGRVINL